MFPDLFWSSNPFRSLNIYLLFLVANKKSLLVYYPSSIVACCYKTSMS